MMCGLGPPNRFELDWTKCSVFKWRRIERKAHVPLALGDFIEREKGADTVVVYNLHQLKSTLSYKVTIVYLLDVTNFSSCFIWLCIKLMP